MVMVNDAEFRVTSQAMQKWDGDKYCTVRTVQYSVQYMQDGLKSTWGGLKEWSVPDMVRGGVDLSTDCREYRTRQEMHGRR